MILHVKRLETQKCLSHPLLCKKNIFLERQNQYKTIIIIMQYIVHIKIYNLDRNIILCNIYVKGKNVVS